MKKMKLKKFFKRCFPPVADFPYILFHNMKTGGYDIVSRSGVIICSIPPDKSLSDKELYQLAKDVIRAFQESSFGSSDFNIADKLCFIPFDSNRYLYPRIHPECLEFAYHPGDYR